MKDRLLLPLIVGSAALFAAACATQPTPVTMPAVVASPPDQWQALGPAGTPGAGSAFDADTPWWHAFDDDRLAALIEEALGANLDLGVAAANVDMALAQARIAGADLWPQLAARFDASERQQVFVGLPIPGSNGVLRSRSTSFGASLDVSWEADLWGRLRAGKRAATDDVMAAAATFEAARLSISAQTAKAWLAVMEATQQMALAETTLDSRRQSVEQIERRYRRGVAPALDLRLARAEQARAASNVIAQQIRRDVARRQLEALLGRYPAGELMASDRTLPPPPASLAPGLPSALVTRRPDLRAAERRLASAGWRVAEARAALFPRLTLTASGGSVSDDLQNVTRSDFSVWSLAGGILAPLFQGGRLRAGVEWAEASRERALAEYAGVALRAFTEVESALTADRFLVAQETALEAVLEEARAASRLAEHRYTAGTAGSDARSANAGYLAVLDSQRQVVQAESQLLSLRQQRLSTRTDLYLALGGGTGPWPDPSTEKLPAEASLESRSSSGSSP